MGDGQRVMTRLDLNARKAARASAKAEAFVVRLGNEQFTLAPEMPFFCLEAVEDNRFIDAVKLLVAPGDWDRFRSCAPTFNDVIEIIEAYGVGLGESSPSQDSSRGTGEPSRLTSPDTTAKILPVSYGDGPR